MRPSVVITPDVRPKAEAGLERLLHREQPVPWPPETQPLSQPATSFTSLSTARFAATAPP